METKIYALIFFSCLVFYYVDQVDCLKCKCQNRCPEYHKNFTCITDGNCFSQIEIDEDGYKRKNMGCLPREDSGETAIFQCRHGVKKIQERNSVLCCHERDFCNEDLVPTLRPTNSKPTVVSHTKDVGLTVIALAVSSTTCILILVIIVVWYCCRRDSWCSCFGKKNQESYRHLYYKDGHIVSNHQTIQQLFETANSGDSGSGLPLLVQRTIARQVQLSRKIGSGQFGCVYEAQWRGDKVAVRIFPSRDEVVWLKECSFYKDVARHDNILAFIASDRHGGSSVTELYMITEYCQHGSLHEYLRCHNLSKDEMLQLATSVACGLAYLHIEVTGTHGKCAIAHRNLTSKGIYVKKPGVCAVGDFALVLRSDCELSESEIEKNPRQAVRLYMAPELLDKTLIAGKSHFGLLLMADVYSLALVLWEIAFRTVSEGIREPYQLPYHGMVSANPSIEELRKVVCVDKKRPPILNRWHGDYVMRKISRVIEECWRHSPNARLTALRVQKTLTSIQDPLNTDAMMQMV